MSFVRVSNRGRRRDGCRVDALEPRTLLATFLVTTSADDGPGSLRQAILDANATPGRDFISAYGRSVQPRSALPAITDPVDLIGPAIDGTDAGPGTGGLVLAAGRTGPGCDWCW